MGSVPGSGRWEWLPTPVGRESCGQRSLEGYILWSCKELDTTEQCFFFPPLGSSRASWQLGTLSFPWPSLHNWSVAMAAPYTTHTVQSEGNSGEKGPFPPVLSIRQSIFPSHLLQISLIFHTVGWPKCSFGFFHNILRKTQMNILANQQYWLCPTLAQLVTQKQALRKLT